MKSFASLRGQVGTRKAQTRDLLTQFFDRQKAITGLSDQTVGKLRDKALKKTGRAFEQAEEAVTAEQGSRTAGVAQTRAQQESAIEEAGKAAEAQALVQGLNRSRAGAEGNLARARSARAFKDELDTAKVQFNREFDESLRNTFVNSIAALKNTGLDNSEDIARISLGLRGLRSADIFGGAR